MKGRWTLLWCIGLVIAILTIVFSSHNSSSINRTVFSLTGSRQQRFTDTMPSNNDLILLTGSSGQIGFRTLRYALEKGYHVRAAVRSEAKAEIVRSNPVLSKIADLDSKLDFVIVPDIVAPGAFDEAVKGVRFVVHIASPLPGTTGTDDHEVGYIRPAVQGTIGLFESAKKESSVERVVVTSSAVALIPIGVLTGQAPTDYAFTAEDRADEIPPPYPMEVVAYVASKIASLRRGEAWMKEQKPDFDVVWINPSYVGGRDDLATKVEDFNQGTNRYFLGAVVGEKMASAMPPAVKMYVHVDDVAKAHIESLDKEKVEGNQAFMLSSDGKGPGFNEQKEVVAKDFPEAVKSGVFAMDGSFMDLQCYADNSKTEKAFGKLKSFDEIVTSVVGHYLEMLEKKKKN